MASLKRPVSKRTINTNGRASLMPSRHKAYKKHMAQQTKYQKENMHKRYEDKLAEECEQANSAKERHRQRALLLQAELGMENLGVSDAANPNPNPQETPLQLKAAEIPATGPVHFHRQHRDFFKTVFVPPITCVKFMRRIPVVTPEAYGGKSWSASSAGGETDDKGPDEEAEAESEGENKDPVTATAAVATAGSEAGGGRGASGESDGGKEGGGEEDDDDDEEEEEEGEDEEEIDAHPGYVEEMAVVFKTKEAMHRYHHRVVRTDEWEANQRLLLEFYELHALDVLKQEKARREQEELEGSSAAAAVKGMPGGRWRSDGVFVSNRITHV